MVYVLNFNGTPLMPCSEAKARHLLKDGKAIVAKRCPFTIKLLWQCESNVQEIVAGMDTGSKIVGVACQSNGKVLYKAEMQLRQDVSDKMKQRRMYRRNRRGRKTRYRKARWMNRASMRRKGRIAPSIESKIVAHLREKRFVESILPVSRWVVELASFDIHKIVNPDVTGKCYQEGNQKGFYNVKAFVLHRDEYTCQKCKTKKGKLQVHHIIFRCHGGTDTPENLITLCASCHDALHRGAFSLKARKSKTKHATEVGLVKAQLEKRFGEFEPMFGYETKFVREQLLGLPKEHYNDAIAICCEGAEIKENTVKILFRKCVSKGDYRQTNGSRSEKRIPTGKLFGLRKYDKVKTPFGIGFVKGKRSSGYFAIANIKDEVLSASCNVKKNVRRVSARKSVLQEEGASSPHLKEGVSAPKLR